MLARLATAGLARVALTPPESAGEALVTTEDPARALLLRAGALALERLAGHRPETRVKPATPCAAETRAPCPPGAAAVLDTLFESSGSLGADLLDEALELLAEREAVLPVHLLPRALATTRPVTRAALRPVLGARGAWLAAQAPGEVFAWVGAEVVGTAASGDAEADLGPLRRVFDEGALEARLEALAAARRLDGEAARAWVAEVFAAEKPEVRVRLLEALAAGLTDADRAFLESVSRDRSATVRLAVIELLARLPESGVAQRNAARLIECVRLDAESGLVVTLTDAHLADKAWAADALPTTAPQAKGLKQFATGVLVGRVPPALWEGHFGLDLPAFVQAAERADFAEALLLGYARAACVHGVGAETDLRPLVRAVIDLCARPRVSGLDPESALPALLARLPEDTLVEVARATLGTPLMPAVLAAVPTPWPEPVALAWLAYARRPERQTLPAYGPFWSSVNDAAGRLPRACLDHPTALLPDPTNPYLAGVTQGFNDRITLRRRIRLEIGGY
jgi:hypothetical protein